MPFPQAAGPISHDLHLQKAQLGLVFGAFGLSYALFELPAGLLGDRLGVRRVLLRIVLAWSAFTALTGAAWSLSSLCAIRFLFGAGGGGMLPQPYPHAERAGCRPGTRNRESLMWAATRWGGAATPPLALAGIALFGWRWAFVAFAAIGVIWCAVFFLWFKDDPAQHAGRQCRRKGTARGLAGPHQSSRSGRTHGWISLLLTPQVFFLILQYFCFSFVWYFYVTWLPTYLREARGQTPGTRSGFVRSTAFVRRFWFAGYRVGAGPPATPRHRFLRLPGDGHPAIRVHPCPGRFARNAVHGRCELLQRSDYADLVERLR